MNRCKKSILRLLSAAMIFLLFPLASAQDMQLRLIVQTDDLHEDDTGRILEVYQNGEEDPYYLLGYEDPVTYTRAYESYEGVMVQKDDCLCTDGRILLKQSVYSAADNPFAQTEEMEHRDTVKRAVLGDADEAGKLNAQINTEGDVLTLGVFDEDHCADISLIGAAMLYAISLHPETIELPLKEETAAASPFLKQIAEKAEQEDITIDYMHAAVRSGSDTEEIRSFAAELTEGAVMNEESGLYEWEPETAAEGHRFRYRISFSLSGLYEIPAYEMIISLPLHILKNRNQEYADSYEMSVPLISEAEESDEFGYRETENGIEIVNLREISAAEEGYFEISYITVEQTFAYADQTLSDRLNTQLSVGTENPVSASTETAAIMINTSASVLSAEKRYPEKYTSWDSIWMGESDYSADEEFLIWEIRTLLPDNITQPYTFMLEDEIFSQQTDTRVIGYRFQSESSFTAENTAVSQTADQMRIDYVLTAHKKSSAEELIIDNTVCASVIPEDGFDEVSSVSASRRYTENHGGFEEPDGSFGSEKYAGYTYYGLEQMQQDQISEFSGLQYHLVMEGYPYPWTRDPQSDPLDPQSYGQNSVRLTMQDDELYLGSRDNRLNEEDYRIESLFFQTVINDAFYDENIRAFRETDPVYAPGDELTVEILQEGIWHNAAVYSFHTGCWLCEADLCSEENDKIIFHQPCAGFRIRTENAHYHTAVNVTASVALNNTDHVHQLISDQDRISLVNTENFTADQNGTVLAEIQRSANNFIRRTFRDSQLKKRVISTANDVSGKMYTITWKLSLSELITSDTYEKIPYVQNGGTFYDLLPAGCTCSPDTVRLETESGFFRQNQFTAEITENFRNSGRSLLVIRTQVPADYYNAVYETYHSWESIRDYGTTVLNPAAYETGNQDIADGFADSGGNLSETNKTWLSGLDSQCVSQRFIYTEQPHDITALTSAVSGLDKKTKGRSSVYSYRDQVKQSGQYSYRLRYETSADTDADHLILFDSLENYVSEGRESGWHGTLEFIDLSQLTAMGIEPKVYISTQDHLDIGQFHDVHDSSVWSDTYSDLSQAKAVAIDLTKMSDGSDFVLAPSQSISAVLYMRAPPALETANTETFNNVWISARLSSMGQQPEEYLIHQDCTEISFRILSDLAVHKADRNDPSIPAQGVTFTIEGTSDYGNPVHVSGVTDENGNLIFRDLEKGSYSLTETDAGESWLRDDTVHTVIINADASVTADGTDCTQVPFTVTDLSRIHTQLVFEKRDLNTQTKPVRNAVFRLSGISDYGNKLIRYARSDESGTVTVEDLEPGTYTLHETEAPEGYIIDRTVYTVTVSPEGIASVEGCFTDENSRMILFNEPLHSFSIVKHSSYDVSSLAGAVFRLKGTADDGTEVLMTETSNARGVTEFTSLHAGTYILQEIQAPEGFHTDNTVRAVRVNHDGSVEIRGLQKNSQDEFIILNQPLRSGTVRIIKRWMDSRPEQRPVPVIHLCSERPQAEQTEAAIDIDLWMDEDTGLPWIAEAVWFTENTELSKEEVLALDDVIRIDDGETEQMILIWPDEDGWQWWSDADIVYLPEDCSGMFASCTELESLDLHRFNSEHVTDMSAMFSNCFSLEELDLSHFDTSHVTDMNSMFHYCKMLSSLNISSFETSQVCDMNSMFIYCTALLEVDISSFDTSNVLYMDSMFGSSTKLTNIYVSDLWSTESVYSGRDMFKNCRKLPNYDRTAVDYTKAYTGEGGYLTYRAYIPQNNDPQNPNPASSDNSEEYVSCSDHFLTDDMSENEKAALRANEDGWWEVLDEDTWVYTFPVISPQNDFWYYEEELEDYLCSETIYSPGFTQNGTGTIVNFRGFIPGYEEMIIRKDVVNDENENIKFRFTVTLQDENEQPLSGQMIFGDTAFDDGVAHVLISGGETYRITGIPDGYHYLVEEEKIAGYSISAENESGVIREGGTVVHFANSREETSDEPVRLRLRKQLAGRYEGLDQEEFVFHVFLNNLEPLHEYSLSDGTVYFSDQEGSADLTVKLKKDEYVDFTGLPCGSTWQICEEGGDYLASYSITTEGELYSSSRTGDVRHRFLSTAVETILSDTEVIFTNRYEYTQNITVLKTCTYPSDEEFEFLAEFEGLEEQDVIECELGSLHPDADGTIRKTFFLSDDDTLTFRNVPVSAVYRFTEESSTWISEYRIEDRNGTGQIVKAYGTVSGAYERLSTREETVNQNEDILITFVNQPQPVSLTVRKTLAGNMASGNDDFHFLLTLEREQNPVSEVSYEKTDGDTLIGAGTMEADENGTVSFTLKNRQEIRFSGLSPGTNYTVQELTEPGYACTIEAQGETDAGSSYSSDLKRNEDMNVLHFTNEKNIQIPTGNRIPSGALCGILLIAAAFLQRFINRF